MREWVDKKCKKEGRPWSILPKFTEDEIKMIKGMLRYVVNTVCLILYFIRFNMLYIIFMFL